jgi:hypothetical protein
MGSEFNYFDGMGRPNDLETGAFMLEIAKLEREGFIRNGNNNDLLGECIRMCNNRQRYPRKAKKTPSIPVETRPIARKKKKTTLPPTPAPETMKYGSLDDERGEEYDNNNTPPPLMGRQDNGSSDDKSDDEVSVSSSVRRSQAQRNQGRYGDSDDESDREEPDQDEKSVFNKTSEAETGDGKLDLSQLDETIKTNQDGNELIDGVKKMKPTQRTWESLVKFFA